MVDYWYTCAGYSSNFKEYVTQNTPLVDCCSQWAQWVLAYPRKTLLPDGRTFQTAQTGHDHWLGVHPRKSAAGKYWVHYGIVAPKTVIHSSTEPWNRSNTRWRLRIIFDLTAVFGDDFHTYWNRSCAAANGQKWTRRNQSSMANEITTYVSIVILFSEWYESATMICTYRTEALAKQNIFGAIELAPKHR